MPQSELRRMKNDPSLTPTERQAVITELNGRFAKITRYADSSETV
jgi:hypothetical protein